VLASARPESHPAPSQHKARSSAKCSKPSADDITSRSRQPSRRGGSVELNAVRRDELSQQFTSERGHHEFIVQHSVAKYRNRLRLADIEPDVRAQLAAFIRRRRVRTGEPWRVARLETPTIASYSRLA